MWCTGVHVICHVCSSMCIHLDFTENKWLILFLIFDVFFDTYWIVILSCGHRHSRASMWPLGELQRRRIHTHHCQRYQARVLTQLIVHECIPTADLFVGTTTRRTLWCNPRRFLRSVVGIIPSSSFVVVFVPIRWQFCRVACVVVWWTARTCR